ncbi:MAG: hypothetical protein M1819_004308 [Sarea resinae]|nr:MAG: hypothetical protein M1819_004308 [Sarea resinae]
MGRSISSSSSTSSLVERRTNPGYVHSGIGGAGNYHKVDSSTPPPASSSQLVLPPRPAASFSSGIGGAGNIHYACERAVLSSYEELARDRARENNTPTVYHVGIGGAGNRAARFTSSSSLSSNSSSQYSSTPLPLGAADQLILKLSKVFGFRKAPTTQDDSLVATRVSGRKTLYRSRQYSQSSFFTRMLKPQGTQ